MKKLAVMLFGIIYGCYAQETPHVLQTMLPQLPRELLAIHAQLAPQTKEDRDTQPQETARFATRVKELEELLHIKDAALKNAHAQNNQRTGEYDALQASLHNMTLISVGQKKKIVELTKELEETSQQFTALSEEYELLLQDFATFKARIQSVTQEARRKLTESRESLSTTS